MTSIIADKARGGCHATRETRGCCTGEVAADRDAYMAQFDKMGLQDELSVTPYAIGRPYEG